jgi:hypothetical protein
LKYLISFTFLFANLFSNNLYSQTITPKDLYGIWILGSGKTAPTFTITNDSTFFQTDSHFKTELLTYTLDSFKHKYYFKPRPTGRASIAYVTFQIIKISADEFSLIPIKESIFMKNSWLDADLSKEEKKPIPLKRKKDN